MKASVLLRPLAASVLLFAAACGGSGPAVNTDNEAGLNETLGNLDDAVPESENEAGDAVNLVSLPPAAADAPAAETAPLAQATEIAGEIDSGAGVERVPFEGGWAWRRGGKIIRTASRDGRRISYFRPGESTPFLVQQGEETFAYAGGRPQRAFDRRGRPGTIPARRQAEARRLADQSRHDRDQAEHAPRRPDNDHAGPARDDHGNSNRGDDHDGNRTGTAPDRDGHGPSAGRADRNGPRDHRRPRRDDDGNHQ
jgi:hypothetical protein